jgi:flagellar motility protein MotE (MotC chaperone)
MTGWLRDFRLMPYLLFAIICLFALKTFGLFSEGSYTLGERLGTGNNRLVVTTVPAAPVTELRSPAVKMEIADARPQKSWMQDVFNYPGAGDITGSVPAAKSDVTGSAPPPKPKEPEKPEPPVESPPMSKAAAGTVINAEPPKTTSPGERALLESLQKRREELDARARELDLRDSMLKAAEKKLETQNAVEKAEEAAGGGGGAKAGPMAQRKAKEEVENARFKSVVTMYETMKPKEAAKIFDRLDIRVLIDVASQMKPQVMAAILAQMSPDAAERLTVELAAKGSDRNVNPSNLPKIDGRPGGT